MIDIFKLPDKYRFELESLTAGKYIDDNSLYVYQSLARGRFSTIDPAMNFLMFRPFEWNDTDFIAFILTVSKEYSFEIKNIKTNFSPIEEEYEVSFEENGRPDVMKIAQYQRMVADALMRHDKTKPFKQPKWYEGAYKWIMDLKEKEDKREEIQLFDKFFTDTATVADIERALIYANRTVPMYGDMDTELHMSKDIFEKIITWTTFFVEITPKQKVQLVADIEFYMEEFMTEKLTRNNTHSKKVGNTSVSQSDNILTFKKHSSLFKEYLQKMEDDFGKTITIENTFEDRFPHYYPTAEDIRKRYLARNFLFMHILFAFEKLDFLKIITLGSNWDYREDELLTYQAKVELLPAFFNENITKKLYFDIDKSRLYVWGKEIKLLKFKDEYHTLKTMFENPKELPQEWFFSEIAERIDESNLNDKKYYNAIYQIRLKLEKQGINDFFITTKQSVKINKKYLS
ncbi:MAG: hypothetical protein WCI93_02730 [bacterium]